MKKMGILTCILAVLSLTANAQEFKKPKRSGYFFVAPGAIAVNAMGGGEPSVAFGGGYEGFLYRGLGIGVEFGGLYVHDESSTKHWAAVFSPILTYDFQRSATQKISPFVVLGAYMASEFQVCCGATFGGGVKYWMTDRFGLRFEFRDNMRSGMNDYHDIQARIALAIR